ncbi:MAG: Holliday junction branch migration protein RuvA [Candidatus Margulisbacteria bacterium]|nr:Holliday junction branch migration protein RuvA [Candidatus Margulisiibacteriota bacterium]
MISHLSGTLEHIDQNHVIIDVGNIGYHVKVPAAVLTRLPKVGEKVKLFTIQVVREDDISLYGFLNKEERALFSLFLSVSGIGPKLALALISGFPIDKLVSAVAQGDIDLLSSISGIGRKTAERIVVELKEKIAKAYAIRPTEMSVGVKGDQSLVSDSISALIALGYTPREARESIMKVDVAGKTSVEGILKEALKALV